MNWIHETIIEEENINISDLPINIKNKLRAFKAQLGIYNKNKADSVLNRVKNMSTSIADELQTWVERDRDDELESQEDESKVVDTIDAHQSSDNAPNIQPIDDNIKTDQTSDKEKEISDIIKRDGYIRVAKLSNIINKSATDSIIEYGSLILRKSTSMFATVYRFN